MMKPITHAMQEMLLVQIRGLGPVGTGGTETAGVALVKVGILNTGCLESATVPPTTHSLLVATATAAAVLRCGRLRIRIKDWWEPDASQYHKQVTGWHAKVGECRPKGGQSSSGSPSSEGSGRIKEGADSVGEPRGCNVHHGCQVRPRIKDTTQQSKHEGAQKSGQPGAGVSVRYLASTSLGLSLC